MGVGLNTMLAAVGAGGVAASKITTSIKEGTISEAVDADKNEMMAQKAKMNAEKLKNLKLRNKKLRLQNRALKEKQNQGKQILKKEEKPNE